MIGEYTRLSDDTLRQYVKSVDSAFDVIVHRGDGVVAITVTHELDRDKRKDYSSLRRFIFNWAGKAHFERFLIERDHVTDDGRLRF